MSYDNDGCRQNKIAQFIPKPAFAPISPVPDEGSTPSFTAKNEINKMPSQNAGIEDVAMLSVDKPLSQIDPAFIPAIIPNQIEPTMMKKIVTPKSSNVFGTVP